MGFDFQMVELPEKLPPAQVKRFKNYVADYEQQLGTFRFFASQMPAVVSVLVVAGVASDEPPAAFPEWPPGRMDEEAAQALAGQMMKGQTPKDAKPAHVEAMKVYLAKRQLVVAARSKNKSQVPLFKLQSNAGWVVTPEECKLIAAAFSAHLDVIAKKKALPAYEREWKKEGSRMPERFRPHSFEQDGPMADKFRDDLPAFIEFNLLAAMHGGYTVL